jgi:hypothetical protein
MGTIINNLTIVGGQIEVKSFYLDLLVIGAGGGGAGDGGGGSGGLVYKTGLPIVLSASNYAIVVGTGSPGQNGGNSCALGFVGLGGGIQSTPGGSGGGTGGFAGGGVGTGLQPGSVWGGFGSPGSGPPGASFASGGVGGGTNGFNGCQLCITGTNLYYGGGGGNGRDPVQGGGGVSGGLGGGGTGGGSTTTATSGTDGTGGGGGGQGGQPSTRGGNGIVIIAYLGPQVANGGVVNTTGRSGYTVHCFANSGTFAFLV